MKVFLVPVTRYEHCELAEDTQVGDMIVAKGTRLIDLFPDGLLIDPQPEGLFLHNVPFNPSTAPHPDAPDHAANSEQ